MTAQVVVNEKKLAWSDLNLHVADVLLKSDSKRQPGFGGASGYQLQIVGSKVTDLGRVRSSDSAGKSWSRRKNRRSIGQEKPTSKCTCSAMPKAARWTRKSMQRRSAKTLIDSLPAESRPLAQMLGFSDEAKVKGNVRILPGQLIEIKDAELPIAIGTVHANGSVDLSKQLTSVAFKGTNLALKRAQDKLNEKMHGGGKR